MKLSEEAREFLEENEIESYTINSDGTVDIDGYVDIRTKQNKFPVKFRRVTSYFYCDKSQLTSLEGVPSYVGSNFFCEFNLLTSLEGTPSYVGGDFYCNHNKLTSLHDIHKRIKEANGEFLCYNNPIKDSVLGLLLIKGIKEILLDNYEVKSILNKYLGQGRAGVIGAQQELFDAGLDEYARL